MKEYITLSGRSDFASNFSRVAFNPGKELKAVGEIAPIFFGKLSAIGFVSTVDGVETSGGTSVLPLPDYSEDTSEPVDTDAKGGGPVSRTIDACR